MRRMEAKTVAYRNLKAEMGRCDVTIEAISKTLGIHRNSVANKLNGASSFSIEEAMKIHNAFFPNMGYKYLFATDEQEVVKVIGLKVKKYLDENGIKYSYLSEKAGIPMNMLSPTLNGKRKMSAEEYFTICEVLGLPAETFAPANNQSE